MFLSTSKNLEKTWIRKKCSFSKKNGCKVRIHYHTMQSPLYLYFFWSTSHCSSVHSCLIICSPPYIVCSTILSSFPTYASINATFFSWSHQTYLSIQPVSLWSLCHVDANVDSFK